MKEKRKSLPPSSMLAQPRRHSHEVMNRQTACERKKTKSAAVFVVVASSNLAIVVCCHIDKKSRGVNVFNPRRHTPRHMTKGWRKQQGHQGNSCRRTSAWLWSFPSLHQLAATNNCLRVLACCPSLAAPVASYLCM